MGRPRGSACPRRAAARTRSWLGADRLLIAGASARALAASAARSARARARWPAGLIALDYFGDVDLDRRSADALPLRVVSLWRDLRLPRTTAAPGRAALPLEWPHVA